MPIYTRTGDTGDTSLFGGTRISKGSDVVETYGLIDELNSYIGLVIALIDIYDVQEFLHLIQSDLFTLGSMLSGWKGGSLTNIHAHVLELEKRIDAMDKELPPINSFILPSGTTLGSHIHITRSIARRVERRIVWYFKTSHKDSPHLTPSDFQKMIMYFNRLSDFLFVLARFVNQTSGAHEIVWKGRT